MRQAIFSRALKFLIVLFAFFGAVVSRADAKVLSLANCFRITRSVKAPSADDLRRQEVRQFVYESMPLFESKNSFHNRDTWVTIVTRLLNIDFNSHRGLSFAWTHPVTEQTDYFKFDSKTVQGMKDLGLIGPDGKLNLKLNLDEVLKKFLTATGLRATTIPQPDHFMSTLTFAKSLRQSNGDPAFPADDIHSILFHLPYLMDEFRLRMAKLTAEFAILESEFSREKTKTPDEPPISQHIFWDLFEGGGVSSEAEERLVGPLRFIFPTKEIALP